METENLTVNQGRQRQVIKQVREILPDISVAVLSETFIVKPVDLGNLSGLVVPSENSDALGISDLEGDKEGNCFDRVVTSVNVVTLRIVGQLLNTSIMRVGQGKRTHE